MQFTYDSLHRSLKTFGDSLPTDSTVYASYGRVIKLQCDSVSIETTYLGLHHLSPRLRRDADRGADHKRRYPYRAGGLLDSTVVTGPGRARCVASATTRSPSRSTQSC